MPLLSAHSILSSSEAQLKVPSTGSLKDQFSPMRIICTFNSSRSGAVNILCSSSETGGKEIPKLSVRFWFWSSIWSVIGFVSLFEQLKNLNSI